MESFKERMNGIVVKSPEDCVWFISGTRRCKIPSGSKTKDSSCHCLNTKMDDMCVWITQFLKSSPEDDDLDDVVLPAQFSLDMNNEVTEEQILFDLNALADMLDQVER